jgi:hypothetical protein
MITAAAAAAATIPAPTHTAASSPWANEAGEA